MEKPWSFSSVGILEIIPMDTERYLASRVLDCFSIQSCGLQTFPSSRTMRISWLGSLSRKPGSAGPKWVFQQGDCLRAPVCVLSPESPVRREKTHLWIFHPNIAGVNRHYRALPITSVSIPMGGRQDSTQPTARGWQATSPLGFSFLPLKAKRERSDCLFLI